MTKQVREQIAAVSFEAAAITAVMAIKDNATKFYSPRAQTTRKPLGKELFE